MKKPNKPTKPYKAPRNPKGKGGFGDHPEHRAISPGRPPNPISYTSALRSYYALTPAELYRDAMRPLKDRADISVAQACALLDAAQALLKDQARQRAANADRLDGKALQPHSLSLKDALDNATDEQLAEFLAGDADTAGEDEDPPANSSKG